MFYFLTITFIFYSVSCANGFALPFEGEYVLNLIHFNDFHARFQETSVDSPTCRFNNNSCLGGFPRLYHEIDVLLKEKPDAVVLNAGDSFQGTYWYTLMKWEIIQKFMNMLPLDAHALGNHEFDDGPSGLVPYLQALAAPMLAANMDVSQEPSLKGLYQPSTVVLRHGRKIGIIGLITTDTKELASPGNVVFTDPGAATQREARALAEQGVDIIILLSHCGLDVDKQLAKDHGKYIDIIVGGHSHSLLWDGDAPSGETVEGPYPVILETTEDKKHKVLIVQASAFTKYMGNMSVYFDYKGEYIKWEGGPIFLNRSIEEDEEIKKKLLPFAKKVQEVENTVVGVTETTMPYEDCVYGECALGNLLTDGMAEYAKYHYDTDEDYISFIQRGNIKSTINEGKITEGILFELLPYNDKVEVTEIQGRYILEALERSFSDAWAYDPFKGPWVLQVSGVHVTYNVSLPEGSRVTSLYLGDVQSVALDEDTYYNVVAPAYLLNGGDGFSMFKDHKRNGKIIGRDQDAIKEYIKKHSPLDVTTYGRIVVNS